MCLVWATVETRWSNTAAPVEGGQIVNYIVVQVPIQYIIVQHLNEQKL